MMFSKNLIHTGLLLAAIGWIMGQMPHGSLWYDETVNAYLATSDWKTIWEWSTAIDNQVPLHFVLLKLWAGAAGHTEFALRLFSAFCGWLAVAGMVRLGRQAGGQGWLSGVILAGCGGFIYAVGEVRAYALALMLLVWSSVWLWRILKGQQGWFTYLGLIILLFLSHYTALLAIGVQFLFLGVWLVRQRFRQWQRVLAVAVIFAVVVAGWLALIEGRDFNSGTAFEGSVGTGQALDAYLGFFAFGQKILTDTQTTMAYLIVATLLLMGLAALVRRNHQSGLLYGLALAIIPLVAMLLAVNLVEAKLSGRHGWMVWPGITLVGGMGGSVLMRSQYRALQVAVVLLIFIGLPAYIALERQTMPDEFQGDFASAFAILQAEAEAGDILILRDGTLFTAAEYYQSPVPYIGLPDEPITNVDHRMAFFEAMDLLEPYVASRPPHIWVMGWQPDIMDPMGLGLAIPEYYSRGERTVYIAPTAPDVPSNVSLIRYALTNQREPLFEHIVRLPGYLQIGTDGPSLLGYDVYRNACDVILHTWWWRGERDYPGAMVSARVLDHNNQRVAIQDIPLANYNYPQQYWVPFTPVLSRFVLQVPCDEEAIRANLVVYDRSDDFSTQTLELVP